MVHITPDRKAAFARDGFLVLPAISKDISHNIEKWANEVKNLPYRPDAWMHYDEVIKSSKSSNTEERVLCRTENFADYHEGFKELFRGAEMTSILEQLTGEPMVLFKEKINYKQPRAGGYEAHIDSLGYRHIGNVSHLSILMAAEPATLENGCLEVVAGSHKMSIPIGKNKCIQQEWCDEQKWIPVPLESGQFLVFGSYLAHRSAPNKSDKGRAAIVCPTAVNFGLQQRNASQKKDMMLVQRFMGKSLSRFGTPMLSIVEDGYKNSGL
ncbi:hypothetical protein EV368DRAFT_68945 [Lentinula lateritia]|nr:hypothetical protein EV368DRAFT_68945 [Lentinula lateritia]